MRYRGCGSMMKVPLARRKTPDLEACGASSSVVEKWTFGRNHGSELFDPSVDDVDVLGLPPNVNALTFRFQNANFGLYYRLPKLRSKSMKTLSLSEAKMKLSALVDAVSSTDEEITITKNGRPVAVLVSPDEFEGWKETQAIMSDADLVKEIDEGLKALRSKKDRLYTLEELFG